MVRFKVQQTVEDENPKIQETDYEGRDLQRKESSLNLESM